jgi:uncharacterized protein
MVISRAAYGREKKVMTIKLRGHHLLCLLGYRGMGYSEDFCLNMTEIYETLRTKPETKIVIVSGPDDVCRAYPSDKPNHCNGAVHIQDTAVLNRLGLEPGYEGSWHAVCSLVAEHVAPADISQLCSSCPWESYGVCQEGVKLVVDGKPLPAVRKN